MFFPPFIFVLTKLDCYNQSMDKRTEIEINNLIALRQLVTNVVIVVVGGI